MQLMLTFASCCLVPTIKNSVLSSLYRFVETPVSKRVRTSELNSGMNVIEIINEYFQTIRTSCQDHENIIDISPRN